MSHCRVFVYGSLKRKFHNHDKLVNPQYVGTGWTECRYRLLNIDGRYPAMIEAALIKPAVEPLSISGELFDLDESSLADLDRFEDKCDYERKEVTITSLEGGTCDQRVVTHSAWTYLWRRSPSEYSVWPTGTWMEAGMSNDGGNV
jgi:gamma-glutamylcyclotransferase (GGCT)/AIG2-like uncharacterized protein YtfP